MRLRLILALTAAAALLAPAGASAKAKMVLKLTAGHPSPVDFAAGTRTAVGKPRTVERSERLRRGETVQVVWVTGGDVADPGACPCPVQGLRPERGTKLVNLVVQAVRGDEPIAVAPARRVRIDGRRPRDLEATYAWARSTDPFPRGTRVVVYGLFVRG